MEHSKGFLELLALIAAIMPKDELKELLEIMDDTDNNKED